MKILTNLAKFSDKDTPKPSLLSKPIQTHPSDLLIFLKIFIVIVTVINKTISVGCQ